MTNKVSLFSDQIRPRFGGSGARVGYESMHPRPIYLRIFTRAVRSYLNGLLCLK